MVVINSHKDLQVKKYSNISIKFIIHSYVKIIKMIYKKKQYIKLLNIRKGTQYVLMTQVGHLNSITGLFYTVIIINFDIKDQLFLSNKNSILRHPLNNWISKKTNNKFNFLQTSFTSNRLNAQT